MQQPAPHSAFPPDRPVAAALPLARLAQTGPRLRLVANPRSSRERCEQIFVTALPTIRVLVSALRRRYRLSSADAEDFLSEVQMRIIGNDYAVLRKFDSRCRLRTFLNVVIRRMFLDYRNAQWGKWRPSARSRRHGELAVRLERLTMRDGLTFDEACAVLETSDRGNVDRTALERIYRRFHRRSRPRFVSDEALAENAPASVSADDALMTADAQRVIEQTTGTLRGALIAATSQDRLMLRLRFAEGLSIAAIARRLELDKKDLYRRFRRLLRRLRTVLEHDGMLAGDVLAALARNETNPGALFLSDNVVAMPGRRSTLACTR